MTFNMQHRQVLTVPSASGIVQLKDSLYVVGDNSAWLYQLNDDYEIKQKHLLIEGIKDSILSKDLKPDFEAITTVQIDGEVGLLIFGSGSKSPKRDVIVHVTFKNGFETKSYKADAFYAAMRSSAFLNSENLNIEAAATFNNALYLFNREENLILEYPLREFLRYLKDQNSLPTFKVYHIKLPQINGLNAKFSGASSVSGSKQLVFTASVENTPNTYDDGEVIGSYIGIINIEDLNDGYEPQCMLLTENSKPIPFKVESIEVFKSINSNALNIIMVTDSDGGDSELVAGSLKW